jgi:hypothetical protein
LAEQKAKAWRHGQAARLLAFQFEEATLRIASADYAVDQLGIKCGFVALFLPNSQVDTTCLVKIDNSNRARALPLEVACDFAVLIRWRTLRLWTDEEGPSAV